MCVSLSLSYTCYIKRCNLFLTPAGFWFFFSLLCLFTLLNFWRWIEEVEEAEMLFRSFCLKCSTFDCQVIAWIIKFVSFSDLELINLGPWSSYGGTSSTKLVLQFLGWTLFLGDQDGKKTMKTLSGQEVPSLYPFYGCSISPLPCWEIFLTI